MFSVIKYLVLIGGAIWLISLVAARHIRCPKCGKRAVQKIEGNRFWKRYSCRRCGETFVEDN